MQFLAIETPMAEREADEVSVPGSIARRAGSVWQRFNRTELLILAACCVILVATVIQAVIMPRYLAAQLRPKFATVVAATEPFKTSIEICAKSGVCARSGALSGLEEGTLGIPYSTSGTYLASVHVARDGTITATATRVEGLAGETYVLKPGYVKGGPITWTVSGSCRTRPGGSIC